MRMSKNFKQVLIGVFVCLLTVCTVSMSGIAAKPVTGDRIDFSKTISAYNKNTQIVTGKKVQSDQDYSKIALGSDSKVNKMDVWVCTSTGKDMSEKYRIYPDNKLRTIDYFSSVTFKSGSTVVFWGEQANINKKVAKGYVYTY